MGECHQHRKCIWNPLPISTQPEKICGRYGKLRSRPNGSTLLDFLNIEFKKGEEFSYDIQENVDYFPAIMGQENATAELFKPRED